MGFGHWPIPGYQRNVGYNCYEGRGATEIVDVNIHVGTGEVDQADKGLIAMQKCAKRCERREGCTAFTVQTTAQNVLLCWLRANVDLPSCERGTKESRRFSTYTRSGGTYTIGRRMQDGDANNVCGVLWFLHVSKCGGSTVRDLLRPGANFTVNATCKACSSMLDRNGWDYAHVGRASDASNNAKANGWSLHNASLWYDALSPYLENATVLPRVFVHHHDGMLPLASEEGHKLLSRVRSTVEARGCAFHLVSLLREPVERALSQAIFILQRRLAYRPKQCHPVIATRRRRPRSNCTIGRFRRLPPPNASGPFVLTIARAQRNYMTRYLTFGDWRQWPSTMWADNDASVDAELLTRASRLLSNATLIGTTARLPSFVDKLAAMMRWRVPPPAPLPISSSFTPPAIKQLYALTADERHAIEEATSIDRELYERFVLD